MQSDSRESVTDLTVVKELLGLVLDAEEAVKEPRSEPADRSAMVEAKAALAAADPAVRAAVERLLAAHRRASGVLLEEKPARPGASDGDVVMAPPRIAGYEIGEEIGRGGFGVVYRAKQLQPVQRPVAVKILRTELASANVIARFRAEARVLAKMSHPGIARVLDAGLDTQHRPFVAMELVEGEPLVAYCDAQQLPVRERVRLMVDVCEAVHHAHQRAVIHRDLKPANILVEQADGRHQPRVIDFGIAKILEEDAAETQTQEGARMGTPRYMSPEQASGTEAADVRSDVYALGVLLCEVLTNQVPRGPVMSGDTTGGSRSKTRATKPSQLAASAGTAVAVRSSELRGDLDRIVLKAVALEPGERYDSAAALADDLARYLEGRPVQATPPSVAYLTRKFVMRHKLVSAAFVLAVTSLVAGTVAATYGLAKANESRIEAEHQQERAEREAMIATEVNEFWLNIIHRGSPQEARRPDLRVREALDLASPRLADQIGDVHIRMRLHETFADAYHALGLSTPQLHHAREAFVLWQESEDPDAEAAVRAHLTLGRALLEANELPEATEMLIEARSICEMSDGPVRRQLPEVLQALARVASNDGDFAEAERILRGAVALSREILGPRHAVTLSTEEKLGLTLAKLHRNQDAVDLLEATLKAQHEELGEDHPDTIATLTVLAMVRNHLGRFEDAERDYHVLIDQAIRTLGEDHSHVLALRHNLAGLLSSMKRFEESEALYWTVREAYQRMNGDDHPNTLTVTANLAIVLTNQKKYEESEPLLREVIDGRTRALGSEHPLTINAQQSLAAVYYYTGRLEEAASQYVVLLEKLRRVVPPGAMHLAPVLRNYGAALRDLNRTEEAVPLFVESYEILLDAAGPSHPETQRGFEFICDALERLESANAFPEWRERCSEAANGP